MKRLLLLCLPLLALAPPAFSAGWDAALEAVDRAHETRDVRDWSRALEWLRIQDHAGAVRAAAGLYEKQPGLLQEWRAGPGRFRTPGFLKGEPLDFYVGLLSSYRHARSIRALVALLVEADPAVADLAASVIRKHTRAHLVGKEVRAACREALSAGDARAAGRLLGILRGRLSVLDQKWVRTEVQKSRTPANLRLDLLLAYPDMALWHEVLQTNGRTSSIPKEDLEAAISGVLEGPALETVGSVLAEALRIEAALAELPPGLTVEALEGVLVRLSLERPWAGLLVVYAHKTEEALRAKPLRPLPALHETSVKLGLAREWNHDRLYARKNQKQSWDRTLKTVMIARRSPEVDFADPEAAALVEECVVIDSLLRALIGNRPLPVIGPPFSADLFRLNRGRSCDVDSIAFDVVERERIDLRLAVLSANRSHPGLTDLERENVRLTNAYRHEFGLLPVRADTALIKSARLHSRFQAAAGQIAHEFKTIREPAGRTPRDRMATAGYPKQFVGRENVLFGTRDPEAAFEWWRRSPGHRASMLDAGFTEIGVGEHGGYWTQNYGYEPYDEDHERK